MVVVLLFSFSFCRLFDRIRLCLLIIFMRFRLIFIRFWCWWVCRLRRPGSAWCPAWVGLSLFLYLGIVVHYRFFMFLNEKSRGGGITGLIFVFLWGRYRHFVTYQYTLWYILSIHSIIYFINTLYYIYYQYILYYQYPLYYLYYEHYHHHKTRIIKITKNINNILPHSPLSTSLLKILAMNANKPTLQHLNISAVWFWQNT